MYFDIFLYYFLVNWLNNIGYIYYYFFIVYESMLFWLELHLFITFFNLKRM